jgi:hypothetical protein
VYTVYGGILLKNSQFVEQESAGGENAEFFHETIKCFFGRVDKDSQGSETPSVKQVAAGCGCSGPIS